MIENYLNIMNESLQKKNTLLDKITENCEKQEALLKQEELSFPEFDALMTEKTGRRQNFPNWMTALRYFMKK